jgi:hypothetical protein
MRDLLAINQHLVISCSYGGCTHKARWTAVEACERLGPDCTVIDATRRLRCAACGGRGKWGHLSVHACTLDEAAWSAREAAVRGVIRGAAATPEAELEERLASLRKLVGRGNSLGGDGPVQWPVDGRSNPR